MSVNAGARVEPECVAEHADLIGVNARNGAAATIEPNIGIPTNMERESRMIESSPLGRFEAVSAAEAEELRAAQRAARDSDMERSTAPEGRRERSR